MLRFLSFFSFILLAVAVSAQTQATLLGNWDDPELVGSDAYDNTYNEIWGIAINGVEYGIIGSTAGLHFINVSNDPSHPFEEHFVKGRSSGGQIIHRDFKDYNGYLYAVADEGLSSLQIIDLRCLPEQVNVVYDSDSLIRRTHNIFIDSIARRLYAFSTTDGRDVRFAMRIYSLEDPVNPVFLAQHRVFDGITIGHVHDGWVDNNLAFLNCGGDGLFIVDFTDPLHPITKDKLQVYPEQGYCHSGWPTADLQYYYMADENHGLDIKAIDISNLADINIMSTFNPNTENESPITHNQIVNCNYLYTSYYFDGLQVFDISDPANPYKAFYYDTYLFADTEGYKGAWGVHPLLPSGRILLSDMQTGLYLFDAIDESCTGRMISADIAAECELQTNVVNDANQLVSIYPNPCKAGLPFQVKGFTTLSDVQLYNNQGQMIQNWTNISPNEDRFIMNDRISPGIYFLKVSFNVNNFKVLPVIIE